MAINLKARRARLTPVTEVHAQEIMATSTVKHAQRYGLPVQIAVPLAEKKSVASADSEHGLTGGCKETRRT